MARQRIRASMPDIRVNWGTNILVLVVDAKPEFFPVTILRQDAAACTNPQFVAESISSPRWACHTLRCLLV